MVNWRACVSPCSPANSCLSIKWGWPCTLLRPIGEYRREGGTAGFVEVGFKSLAESWSSNSSNSAPVVQSHPFQAAWLGDTNGKNSEEEEVHFLFNPSNRLLFFLKNVVWGSQLFNLEKTSMIHYWMNGAPPMCARCCLGAGVQRGLMKPPGDWRMWTLNKNPTGRCIITNHDASPAGKSRNILCKSIRHGSNLY